MMLFLKKTCCIYFEKTFTANKSYYLALATFFFYLVKNNFQLCFPIYFYSLLSSLEMLISFNKIS